MLSTTLSKLGNKQKLKELGISEFTSEIDPWTGAVLYNRMLSIELHENCYEIGFANKDKNRIDGNAAVMQIIDPMKRNKLSMAFTKLERPF